MNATRLQEAHLQFPTPKGRRWLRFRNPIGWIQADELRDVPGALREAEAASSQGHWVVGMVSYDAGPAFDSAIRAARIRRVPLVSFGIFTDARPSEAPAHSGGYEIGAWTANRSPSAYLTAVRTIRELIAAGETYQTNYTIRRRAPFTGDPEGLFGDLARAQQADYSAYLDLGDRFVCSASPELFFRQVGRMLISKPMKGTAGRQHDPDMDRLAAEHLARSEKDLAENTMIVDMVRNDFSRICDLGTVRVPALHTVETYPTVHTMTSTVTGETDAGVAAVFDALFPGASITGAPKVRTSEIIEALEGDGRGVYTGAVGAISPEGITEFNIAIRTVWVDRDLKLAEYGVGGGIVWDSDPDEEQRETEHKSRVLHRARGAMRLLETIRWEPTSGAWLLDEHLDRLSRSAAHFGFDVDLGRVRDRLSSFVATEPRRLRLLVDPTGEIVLDDLPLPDIDDQPWRVAVDDQPVPNHDEFLFHKTTNRDLYDSARQRHRCDELDGPSDVILVNERGEPTELTIGNLVAEVDGELRTPPVSAGLLPGTFRARLLAEQRLVEATLTVDDLHRADRLWMINALRGWVPIALDSAIDLTIDAMHNSPIDR